MGVQSGYLSSLSPQAPNQDADLGVQMGACQCGWAHVGGASVRCVSLGSDTLLGQEQCGWVGNGSQLHTLQGWWLIWHAVWQTELQWRVPPQGWPFQAQVLRSGGLPVLVQPLQVNLQALVLDLDGVAYMHKMMMVMRVLPAWRNSEKGLAIAEGCRGNQV